MRPLAITIALRLGSSQVWLSLLCRTFPRHARPLTVSLLATCVCPLTARCWTASAQPGLVKSPSWVTPTAWPSSCSVLLRSG